MRLNGVRVGIISPGLLFLFLHRAEPVQICTGCVQYLHEAHKGVARRGPRPTPSRALRDIQQSTRDMGGTGASPMPL